MHGQDAARVPPPDLAGTPGAAAGGLGGGDAPGAAAAGAPWLSRQLLQLWGQP